MVRDDFQVDSFWGDEETPKDESKTYYSEVPRQRTKKRTSKSRSSKRNKR